MKASEAGVAFADKRGAVRDRPTAERAGEVGTMRIILPRIRVRPADGQRGRERQGAFSDPRCVPSLCAGFTGGAPISATDASHIAIVALLKLPPGKR